VAKVLLGSEASVMTVGLTKEKILQELEILETQGRERYILNL
jgi:hypothetical protein